MNFLRNISVGFLSFALMLAGISGFLSTVVFGVDVFLGCNLKFWVPH